MKNLKTYKLFEENVSEKIDLIHIINTIIIYCDTEYISLGDSKTFKYKTGHIFELHTDECIYVDESNNRRINEEAIEYEVLPVIVLRKIVKSLLMYIDEETIEFSHDYSEELEIEEFEDVKKVINLIGNKFPNSDFYSGNYELFKKKIKAKEFNL